MRLFEVLLSNYLYRLAGCSVLEAMKIKYLESALQLWLALPPVVPSSLHPSVP